MNIQDNHNNFEELKQQSASENNQQQPNEWEYNQKSTEINELEAKCLQLEDQAKRSMADYHNLLRRTQQEREQSKLYGSESAIRALIPCLDNFYYATKSFNNQSESSQLLDSIKMIWGNLIQCLESIGFKLLHPNGEAFNPIEHEAVTQIPSDSPEGTIVEVFRPGYVLHDRVLKPAQVAVAVKKVNS